MPFWFNTVYASGNMGKLFDRAARYFTGRVLEKISELNNLIYEFISRYKDRKTEQHFLSDMHLDVDR